MSNSDSKRLRAVIDALEKINVGAMSPSIARSALLAVDAYDTIKFADGELEKFWSSDFHEKTYDVLASGLLSKSVERMSEFCIDRHKDVKDCDCIEIQGIALGILK